MENEKAKKLAEMVSGLPEQMQNLALNYIQGLVDGRAIREAMEKKKKEETETREGA
jgi:hypothetical protein